MHGEPNMLVNTDGGVLNGTGTTLTNTQKLYATNQNLSPGRHISLEFWALNLIEADPFIKLLQGTTLIATVTVTATDYVVTFNGGGVATFVGANTNTLTTGWSFVGVSFGWDGRSTTAGGMVCLTTYSGGANSNCVYNLTLSSYTT